MPDLKFRKGAVSLPEFLAVQGIVILAPVKLTKKRGCQLANGA